MWLNQAQRHACTVLTCECWAHVNLLHVCLVFSRMYSGCKMMSTVTDERIQLVQLFNQLYPVTVL